MLSRDIQRLILGKVGENYFPILRLVCKKWYQLLKDKNNRCSLIRLIRSASLSLVKYLEFWNLTDYSNYRYFVEVCESEQDFIEKKKILEYFKSISVVLISECYNAAITIKDIKTIQWLYDNLCPLPICPIYIDYYDIDLSNSLEKLGIQTIFKNDEKKKDVFLTKNRTSVFITENIKERHFDLAKLLVIEYDAKPRPSVWISPIKTFDVQTLEWLNMFVSESFHENLYFYIFENKNINVRNWFLKNGYFKNTTHGIWLFIH